MHNEPHPLAGKTVKLKSTVVADGSGVAPDVEYRVEDYWDRVSGGSWMFATGNPAALNYAMRSGLTAKLPLDDEVLYGKIGPFGHLIHVSELADESVLAE